MNTKTKMRMPGFTAEASLYVTDKQYQNGEPFQQSGPNIRPAQIDEFTRCVFLCGKRGGKNCPQLCAYLLG
jgi:hypothetical protein